MCSQQPVKTTCEEDEDEEREEERRGDEPWLAATHLGTFSKQGRKSDTPGKN